MRVCLDLLALTNQPEPVPCILCRGWELFGVCYNPLFRT
jgi:hypothetical protein